MIRILIHTILKVVVMGIAAFCLVYFSDMNKTLVDNFNSMEICTKGHAGEFYFLPKEYGSFYEYQTASANRFWTPFPVQNDSIKSSVLVYPVVLCEESENSITFYTLEKDENHIYSVLHQTSDAPVSKASYITYQITKSILIFIAMVVLLSGTDLLIKNFKVYFKLNLALSVIITTAFVAFYFQYFYYIIFSNVFS